jgi:hypothetical protein
VRSAAIPLETIIIDHAELPVYLRIAHKSKRLRQLGMSDRAIARGLRVSDKTVAKAADEAEFGARGSQPTRDSVD